MRTFAFLAALALAHCGGVEADFRGGDATSAPADSTNNATNDAGTYVAPPACTMQPEICGDKVDNNCNGQVDEAGCLTPGVNPNPMADEDGDGYPDGPSDCGPKDPAIHPGAKELCNGVDDNCDGVTDEGCPATTNPPPVSGSALTSTFTWPTSGTRTARYQIVYHKAELFAYWNNANDPPVTGTSITLTAAKVEGVPCGVRYNTAEGDGSNWTLDFAYGHSSTNSATINPNIGFGATFGTLTATKANLISVSHPSGVAGGSSAYWRWRTDPDCP